MDGARQAEIVDLAARSEGKLKGHPTLQKAVEQFQTLRVLPGVRVNAIAAFPANTSTDKINAVYWGVDEPWKLDAFYLSGDEIRDLRATLK